MAKLFQNSLPRTKERKKKKPQLKLVPISEPYAQQDILEQLEKLTEMAKTGQIDNLVIYCEQKNGTYFIHTSPSEDTCKTAANLLQMSLIRMGFR
jgi:hypothetical protein